MSYKSVLKYKLHGKRFTSTANPSGLSNAETVFQYFVNGAVVTGHYEGGAIVKGQLVGRKNGNDPTS